jgi:hypothetical protein
MIGHVPAEMKTAFVALKTEFSRSEYEQFLGNELFDAVE